MPKIVQAITKAPHKCYLARSDGSYKNCKFTRNKISKIMNEKGMPLDCHSSEKKSFSAGY